MKQVYISRHAGTSLVRYLVAQGYQINTVTEYGIVNQNTNNLDDVLDTSRPVHVDPRLATHPDIYMCQLGLWNEAGIFVGDPERLGPEYPNDIIYNAVCTRDFVFHLIEKTDRELMDAIITWRQGLAYDTYQPDSEGHFHEETKVIGVRQGYTRCSCLPVNNDSFILSDKGVANALEAQGASVLLIEEGHIKLRGFEHGFIGGTAGNIYINSGGITDQKAIVFNGDLSVHPDFKRITGFIKSRNILPVWFEDYALEDIGSILAIE